jgi:cytochrome c biogenesis protein CcdA
VISHTPTVSHLSQVIAQAVAPAFILGALAALISVLVARLNRVVDRSQALNAIGSDDPARAHLKGDLPRLKRRAVLLNNAVLFASISAIFVTLLVIVAFVSAFFEIEHERGIAVFFIVTLGFFAAALVNLARETRIALHEFDYY